MTTAGSSCRLVKNGSMDGTMDVLGKSLAEHHRVVTRVQVLPLTTIGSLALLPAVMKYDWPVLNVTDSRYMQSPARFFSEGASSSEVVVRTTESYSRLVKN